MRARGVAERRVRGDVVDPLAVDIDLAAVAQALEIFAARERPVWRGEILGLDPSHGRFLFYLLLPVFGRRNGVCGAIDQERPFPPRNRGRERTRAPASEAAAGRGPIDRAEKWPHAAGFGRHESGDCWNKSAGEDRGAA